MLDKNILILIIPLILVVTISGVPITNSKSDDPAKKSNEPENTAASSPKPDAPTKDKDKPTSVIAIKVPPEEKKGTPRPMLFIHSVGKTTTTTTTTTTTEAPTPTTEPPTPTTEPPTPTKEPPTPTTEPPTPATTTKPEEDRKSTPRPILVLYSIPTTTTSTTTTTTTAAPTTTTTTAAPTTTTTTAAPTTTTTTTTAAPTTTTTTTTAAPTTTTTTAAPTTTTTTTTAAPTTTTTTTTAAPTTTTTTAAPTTTTTTAAPTTTTTTTTAAPTTTTTTTTAAPTTTTTTAAPTTTTSTTTAAPTTTTTTKPTTPSTDDEPQTNDTSRPKSWIKPNNPPSPDETVKRPKNFLRDYDCPKRKGFFPYPDKCDVYIECKDYIPLTYICPDGLYFNPDATDPEDVCDDPSEVDCENEEPDCTQSPTGVPSNILRGYTCPKTHGFFSYPGKCDVYIMCEQDTPLTYICPEGLQFNPNAWRSEHVCDHPSVVTCENREQRPSIVRPVDTRPTLEIARQPWSDMDDFSCPTPNGYFKLTDQCDEYVECRGYTPLRYICPDGLHFKTDAQWTEYPCTHPMLSQCS